jgi:uncharacterized phage protein (TIGR01671 family)
MREIKFRAWINGGEDHDYNNVMTYDLAFEEYAPINKLLNDINEGGALMQYTGQNKDGKEIYEGDILFDGIDKYKVIWLDGGWVIESIEYGDIVRLSASNLEDGFKVIGNIYENPELLSE